MTTASIQFTAAMARAIEEGRKIQTRRPLKPQPPEKAFFSRVLSEPDGRLCAHFCDIEGKELYTHIFPAYQPGDVLRVAEPWGTGCMGGYTYLANVPDGASDDVRAQYEPADTMPEDAARLFIKIADVRCLDLQQIPMLDLLAEGVIPKDVAGCWPREYFREEEERWRREYFRPVWEEMYGRDLLLRWISNPWVWVYEFDKAEG
jgi:hypothetical protein